MNQVAQIGHRSSVPTFAELFTPKLVTMLREGYGLKNLRAHVIAGLTVAIVALPLSMAIAIASGTTPDRGLYTAIVGGFLISLLGGSRFQVGGPAGAFIVLVAATIAQHGIEGVLLATIVAGVILLVSGFLRLGTYVKHIPYPVTVGFTAGIAVIILASQIKDLLGLTLSGQEPGEIIPKLEALGRAITTANAAAIQVALFTVAIIAGVKRFLPRWPDMLIAVVCAAGVSALLRLPVATIGSRFGEMPHGLPIPSFPAMTLEKITEILPNAFAFAFLCAIESLLSAVVADTMTGRKHRSNCELVAQGITNIASGLFGGICVTGLIARTGTNVRAGAQSPLAGMFHAVFLLLFMLIAASLARFIPLAALAAVLAVVAWSMVEKEAFMRLLRCSRADALILLSTALLTVFRSLTEGIIAGCAIAAFLFIKNKYRTLPAESRAPLGSDEDTQSRPSERSLADL